MKNRLKFYIGFIIVVGIIGIASLPHALDRVAGKAEILKENPQISGNYVLNGLYHKGNILAYNKNYTISKYFSDTIFYKECSHLDGDVIKYYGYYEGDFSTTFYLKRELC